MKIVKYVLTIAVPEIANESVVIDEIRDMFRYEDSTNTECALCSVEIEKLGEDK